MKALIVEDELLARAGLHALLDWKEMGVELLEDAKDGNEALERIRACRPELLLLDINIPVISGLELLKIIKEEGIPLKTIVISCYDDFDTVKMAMKLGAVDYVRKFGLTREELAGTLSNIIDHAPVNLVIGGRKSAAQERRDRKREMQEAPEGFENGSCMCLCMLWKNGDEMADLKIVETICSQFYHGLKKETAIRIFEGKILLFQKEKSVSTAEIEGMQKQIRHFVASECYVSMTDYDSEMISESFFAGLANTLEMTAFYGSDEQIMKLEQPAAILTACPFAMNPYYDRLDKALDQISADGMKYVLNDIFSGIEACRTLSVNLVRRLMIEVLGHFSDRASQLGGAMEEVMVSGNEKHYQTIVHCTNFKDMKEWFYRFAEEFEITFFDRQKKADSDLIFQVLTYIDERLTTVIQLGEAAKYAGVSEPYLSTYFKKVMGENFIPYVNRKKIEAGKKMLTEGRLIYQVSDILGFENSTYFSKLFKKLEGMTPEQYRKTSGVK